ncbi:MAG: sodium-dependent transporter [Deltaproteobacteria bacterium]|nr:MAG: sodium-dependent transporter [Deltaproteobacteria bacterium]
MAQRENWGTRTGFILAAVGSAIGLGNIWRFPYMVYDNGGGAFLIPYFFALITAGIPIIIMEFGLGSKYKGAAPKTFSSLAKKWEWIGWWQVIVAFVISVYYVVVIGWAVNYTKFSFTQSWGTDTKSFFFGNFLKLSDSALNLGGIVWPVFIGTSLIWLITWLVLFSGVKKGIEFANKIFMPVLFILIILIMARAVTLEGALDGINYLFKPDFSKVLHPKVWVDAYGQIFFTLSICFAIMITYSSYLEEGSDINNNGMMTAFINCGFSMIAGIMVFGVLGHMAAKQGVGVQDVAGAGVGLAFVTIPKAINFLPAPWFFGPLFFISIVFAGLSSMISISEACCSAIIDNFSITRKTAVTAYAVIGFLVSIIFMTNGGLYVLDITDHFINNFGIVFAGIVEVLFVAWIFNLESLREYINSVSDFAVGKWWSFCLMAITPVVLGYMGIRNLVGDLEKPYEGYPVKALVMYGWAVIMGAFIAGVIIHSITRDNNK